jgi:hypothetical protein
MSLEEDDNCKSWKSNDGMKDPIFLLICYFGKDFQSCYYGREMLDSDGAWCSLTTYTMASMKYETKTWWIHWVPKWRGENPLIERRA